MDLEELAARQGGLVTAAQCVAAGLSYDAMRARIRRREWTRPCQGAYLLEPDRYVASPDDAVLRGSLLVLGAGAAAVLGTAARLHRIEGLPPGDGTVAVSRPRSSPRKHRPGVSVHHFTLPEADLASVDGIPVTAPLRTLVDLVPRVGRRTAVSLIDSALNKGLIADAAQLRERWVGRPRTAWARSWSWLADGRAASPLETRVRLDCVKGEVPPEELQYPVYDGEGVLLGIADLAWPSRRILVEADGVEPHERPQALLRDRRRQNDLVRAGYTVLRFTWADTWRRGYIAATIRHALAGRRVDPAC